MKGNGSLELLEQEIRHRQRVDSIFGKFNVEDKTDIVMDYTCLKASIEHFKSICNEMSDYSLKYIRKLAIACETISSEDIKKAFLAACQ